MCVCICVCEGERGKDGWIYFAVTSAASSDFVIILKKKIRHSDIHSIFEKNIVA